MHDDFPTVDCRFVKDVNNLALGFFYGTVEEEAIPHRRYLENGK